MMEADGTRAAPEAPYIDERGYDSRPFCPVCNYGSLHPYKVSVALAGIDGYDIGMGWLVKCIGGKKGPVLARDIDPCGFTMPITAYQWVNGVGLVPEGHQVPEPPKERGWAISAIAIGTPRQPSGEGESRG